MPSNFVGFDIQIDLGGGALETVPAVTAVEVRDVTDADPVTGVGAIALTDIASDSSGHVAAGTVSVAVGRTVRFAWFRDVDARCGSAIQITT
jgi:hypothetical protein